MRLGTALRRTLYGFMAVAAVFALALYWLLHTESGARWAIDRVAAASHGALESGRVEGSLSDGLKWARLRLRLDSAEVSAEQLQARISLAFAPLELRLTHLEAATLSIVARETPSPNADAGTRKPFRMPLAVNAERVHIAALQWLRDGTPLPDPPLSVQASFRLDDRLDLRSLLLESGHFRLHAAGQQALSVPYAGAWSGTLNLPEDWARELGFEQAGARFEARGDAARAQLRLDSLDGRASLALDLVDWLNRLSWQGELNAAKLQPRAIEAALGGPLETLRVAGSGEDRQYQLDVSALLPPGPAGSPELLLTGNGDTDAFRIESARLTANELDLQATGDIGWVDGLSARLSVRLIDTSLNPWWAAWPATAHLAGSGDLSWENGNLSVQALELATASTQLTAHGNWSESRAEARLAWQNLQWPPGPDSARLVSRSGRIDLEGKPADWRLAGAIRVAAAQGPEADLSLQGAGDLTHADLLFERGELLGGWFQGSWAASWDHALTWEAEVDATGLDLTALHADWPVDVGGHLRVIKTADRDALCFTGSGLHGRYQGESVTANGGLCSDPDGLEFDALVAEAPGSRLAVDGTWGKQGNLDADLRAERGGLLARMLGGAWGGRAEVRWQSGLPRYTLDFEGQGIEFGDWSFATVQVQGQAGPAWPGAVLAINVGQAGMDAYRMEQVSLRLLGRANGHELTVAGSGEDRDFSAHFAGRLSGWTRSERPAWSGTLEELQARLDGDLLMSLIQPQAFKLSADGLELDRACVALGGDAVLCASMRRKRDGALDVEADAERVPLALIHRFIDTDLRFSQMLGGSVRWSRRPGVPPDGAADILISPGVIERPGENRQAVSTGAGRFRFQLERGQLDQGLLLLPFPGLGRMEAQFRISDLVLDGTGRVSGHILADLDQLDRFAVFIPGIENLAGDLRVDADLGGVVSAPTLDGGFSLADARFDVPALGLKAVQLDLDGRLEEHAPLELTGRLQSGSGSADLEARLSLSDWNAPRIELRTRGENLTILDVPSLTAKASPDLKVNWTPGHFTVDGRLLIPEARIEPAESVTDRVAESQDVVVVAGQLPVTSTAGPTDDFPMHGRLLLILGDRVRVQMPAVQMRASGQVELSWRQTLLPTANGLIDLNGEVRTFGPLLNVEQGRVRFQDRPLDDPTLDIRAKRDIFGNTQIQSAGVRVGGTARRPEVTAYTQPLTTEERAWTLLVTGSDFEYGQGVGGFDIGTYVAPRLYISYGISLFDDERTVSARYDLKRGFGIKATSSQKENGVDVSYTVER